MGLSPFMSSLELYAQKTAPALVETKDLPVLRWGRLLQSPIITAYEEETGFVVARDPELKRSKQHPFMIAHLDGETLDRVVEAKTARTDEGYGEPGTDQVPPYILLQATHQMIVAEIGRADIPVLIGGSDFRIYTVRLDAELANMLIAGEAAFWRRVIEHDPPAATSLADAALKWPTSREVRIELPAEAAAALDRLQQLRGEITRLESLADDEELAVKDAMQEADTATINGIVRATWRTAKSSNVLDGNRLKLDMPQLFAEYLIERVGSRRFLLKG
jgi:putative phage-type endonuclease